MPEKFLIVGLGNPGRRYAGTPHNVGFDAVELLAKEWGVKLQPSKQVEALDGKARADGCAVHLLLPTTYMNLSGGAVGPYMQRHALLPEQLLVIYDEIDLPLGRIRLRERGSHAGHKGMLSICNALSTRELARIRIGIRPPQDYRGELADYVLRKLPPEERQILREACELAAQAARVVIREGIAAAMNEFNPRK